VRRGALALRYSGVEIKVGGRNIVRGIVILGLSNFIYTSGCMPPLYPRVIP